jgi:hypothetical protein
VCEFPEPIRVAIHYVFMLANQVQSGAFPVCRTFTLFGMLAIGFLDGIKRLFEKLRRFNLSSIEQVRNIFKPKSNERDSTRLEFGLLLINAVYNDDHE